MTRQLGGVGNDPLSPEENEDIFRNRIVSELFTGKRAQIAPRAIILSGQSGIGKSSTTDRIVAELGDGREPVVIGNDLLRDYYPNYRKLLRLDDPAATSYARPDRLIWIARALAYAREHGFNVILDGNTSNPISAAERIREFREAGYRVEADVVAGPRSRSRRQVLSRYLNQREREGFGRYVSESKHDSTYDGVLAAIAAIEKGRLVDRLTVNSPEGELLYANELDSTGSWLRPAGACEVIQRARAQLPSGRDITKHCRLLREAVRTLDSKRWSTEIAGIAATLPFSRCPTQATDGSIGSVSAVIDRVFSSASRTRHQLGSHALRASETIPAVGPSSTRSGWRALGNSVSGDMGGSQVSLDELQKSALHSFHLQPPRRNGPRLA